jgi:hypothetical protein
MTTPSNEASSHTAYYVDGYHGGIAGHMPMGSIRDILREMERKPGWKVSLEIEPFSWEPLRRRDRRRAAWRLSRGATPSPTVGLLAGRATFVSCSTGWL